MTEHIPNFSSKDLTKIKDLQFTDYKHKTPFWETQMDLKEII